MGEYHTFMLYCGILRHILCLLVLFLSRIEPMLKILSRIFCFQTLFPTFVIKNKLVLMR